jgi:hypothetical protein
MTRGRASVFFLMALAMLSPGTFGATADKAVSESATIQAVLLDHNEFLCSNCLFGMSDYYFCFDANDRILLGHEKVRGQTWKQSPVDLLERGKTVPLRYDDKYIWVMRSNGKEAKLTQDYTKKIFLKNDRCQAAVKSPEAPAAKIPPPAK